MKKARLLWTWMRKKIARKGLAGIHIRDIEKKFFSYLFINKVATSRQIARDVYVGMSHQALYKRLNILIRHGYLRSNYEKELNGQLVYFLSEKAAKEFVLGTVGSGIRRQLKSDSILHDLDLVDIRHRLKNLEAVKTYYSENVLRSGVEIKDSEELVHFRNFRFDGAIKVERQGKHHFLALEYERSLKFSNRYLPYFAKLYVNPIIEAVLFICGNEKILSHIRHIERQSFAKGSAKIFYALLSDMLDSNNSVSFENTKGEKITLH